MRYSTQTLTAASLALFTLTYLASQTLHASGPRRIPVSNTTTTTVTTQRATTTVRVPVRSVNVQRSVVRSNAFVPRASSFRQRDAVFFDRGTYGHNNVNFARNFNVNRGVYGYAGGLSSAGFYAAPPASYSYSYESVQPPAATYAVPPMTYAAPPAATYSVPVPSADPVPVPAPSCTYNAAPAASYGYSYGYQAAPAGSCGGTFAAPASYGYGYARSFAPAYYSYGTRFASPFYSNSVVFRGGYRFNRFAFPGRFAVRGTFRGY